MRVEGQFLWRLKDSNFWLGPSLSFANIANKSFRDLDPTIDHRFIDDPNVTTSGQMFDIMLKSNYYFNPQNLFVVYATAAAGYRLLMLNYRGVIKGENINTSTFVGAAGIGVQTYLDDLLVGLEVREFFSPYSSDFKDSSKASTVASVTFSWKF